MTLCCLAVLTPRGPGDSTRRDRGSGQVPQTVQINEALTKVLAHNLCVVIQSMYELNVTPEFWSEAA
jgi:hypothetical protein